MKKIADDGRLLCPYCGKTYHQLGNHAGMKHGLKADAFKAEVGLLQKSALVSERVRHQMTARGLRSMASGQLAELRKLIRPGNNATGGARNKRRPEALNKTGRCLAQIVAVAQSVSREHGGRVTLKRMRERGILPQSMVPYGGYQRIIELANVRSGTIPRSYADEQLLTMLRDLASELGRTPAGSDLRRYGLPSDRLYRNRFGSLVAAHRRAGLIPNLPIPLDTSGEAAILVAYATTGNTHKVAERTYHGQALVRETLRKYDVPLEPGASHRERIAAREWAAEVARRLTNWPEAVPA